MTKRMSAGELADRLAPMKKILLGASPGLGLAAFEPHAAAGLGATTQGAYAEGYATGQAYAAEGNNGTSYGITGDPAIDNSYNQGFLDGIEGVAACPPDDNGNFGD